MTEQVVIVARDGTARVMPIVALRMTPAERADRAVAEQKRINAVKEAACIPESCGPEIIPAPGRGPMRKVTHREMAVTDSGGIVSRKAGYKGRDGAMTADVFDRMERASRRAWRATCIRRKAKGLDELPYVPVFTPGQLSAARDYAALVERVEASGVKCASLETIGRTGAGGGDREVAILADFQRLRALNRRIGDGLAKGVRRRRPSETTADPEFQRMAIRTRRLVQLVCVADKSLYEVLELHNWVKSGRLVADLRKDLCAALDRMQGYDRSEK